MIYSLTDCEPKLPKNEDFWIADTASIIGKVEIEKRVSVWFGAVLRGDNELIFIGKGSNVQENCILHTDMGFALTIGENCTIGHGAIIHGASIQENCLIGMGTTILNGAKVRENSLVGAGSLITENKEFPPNVLIVGRPAKVIRELHPEEVEAIQSSAIKYQENGKNFKLNCQKL